MRWRVEGERTGKGAGCKESSEGEGERRGFGLWWRVRLQGEAAGWRMRVEGEARG